MIKRLFMVTYVEYVLLAENGSNHTEGLVSLG